MKSISTNNSAANRYSMQISGKAASIESEGDSPDGEISNLKASKNCNKCFDKKDTMIATYASIVAEDAANIAKIHASFNGLDKQIRCRLKARS